MFPVSSENITRENISPSPFVALDIRTGKSHIFCISRQMHHGIVMIGQEYAELQCVSNERSRARLIGSQSNGNREEAAMFEAGISQLVLANLSMEDFFTAVAAAGYETVELSLRKEGALTGSVTDARLAETNALAGQYKLPVCSLTLGHGSGNLLDSGANQKQGIEETIFGLEVAAKLGAPCTLHTLGRFSADLYYDDAYHNAVAALKKLAPVCQSLGVALAFEFVWNGFLFSPLEVRRFLDEVGSPWVGFYFDPGNMAVFQFPHHWVRIIGSHIKRVHLKDWKGRALKGEWTPLLQGEVDFTRVMKELRGAGYSGPLVSEVAPSLASLEETAQTIRKIRSL